VEPGRFVPQIINDTFKQGGHFVKRTSNIDMALRLIDKVFVDVLIVSMHRDFSSASTLRPTKAINPIV
jgi:hypothetical protein